MKQSPAVVSMVTRGSLLDQYNLLCAVIDAPWATRLDHKIARHVIERYYARYGNARASLRYLEVATGAMRNKIIPSLRRIIDNGAISILRQGRGTRPTEYDLNFEFGTKVSIGALEGPSISGAHEGTSSGSPEGTSIASSGARKGTKTYLRNMPTGMLTLGMIETPAVPTAPPVPGLEADPAASAVAPEGFDELWNVFPRKHHRAKGRAAYAALAPNRELHARLVASETAWADHYRTASTETKWQKHLHTWLAEERYLEDLPEPYENPKEAATKRAPRPVKTQAAGKSGLSSKTPLGRHDLVITDCQLLKSPANSDERLTFDYRIQGGKHDGKKFSHTFLLLCDDDDIRLEGDSLFADIRKAAGIFQANDPSDLVDLTLCATVSGMGQIRYEARA